jgi:hypothetical protein
VTPLRSRIGGKLDVETPSGRSLEVFVSTQRLAGYVFWTKRRFTPATDRFAAIVLLAEAEEPEYGISLARLSRRFSDTPGTTRRETSISARQTALPHGSRPPARRAVHELLARSVDVREDDGCRPFPVGGANRGRPEIHPALLASALRVGLDGRAKLEERQT